MATSSPQADGFLYTLAGVGLIVGLGKLLASDEPLTFRKVFGHGIVSGGLGAAASLILIPLPDLPLPVLIGAACALSSVGASALALFLQKYVEKK